MFCDAATASSNHQLRKVTSCQAPCRYALVHLPEALVKKMKAPCKSVNLTMICNLFSSDQHVRQGEYELLTLECS